MKKINFISILLFLFFLLSSSKQSFSQNVGIGTTTPNAKAALEIKATDKGVLFPRLTSIQRDAITNPPNGLHVFNTDERCLNYYDSLYNIWNCYCENDTCKVVTINITADACNINFYSTYAVNYPGIKKFSIIISPGINIVCGSPAIGSVNFNTMPGNAAIKIINYGNIYGSGGAGGDGAAGQVGSCSLPALNGSAGGHAITTKAGVLVTVINYGFIAGGGGGGGGGGKTALGQYGGGGGGGAALGTKGNGGGNTILFISCLRDLSSIIAQSGTNGLLLTPGNGGLGANGGGNGGNGGALAQPGFNGTGTAAGTGGAGGKAISGGSGNNITNISGGQSFGVVD